MNLYNNCIDKCNFMVYWNMTCDKGFNPAGFHYQLYLKLVKQEALIYLLLYDAASSIFIFAILFKKGAKISHIKFIFHPILMQVFSLKWLTDSFQ